MFTIKSFSSSIQLNLGGGSADINTMYKVNSNILTKVHFMYFNYKFNFLIYFLINSQHLQKVFWYNHHHFSPLPTVLKLFQA